MMLAQNDKYLVTPAHASSDIAGKLPSAMAIEGIWKELQAVAAEVAANEPLLRRRMQRLVLEQASLGDTVAAVLADKLSTEDMPPHELSALIGDTSMAESPIAARVAADLSAVKTRDPACMNLLQVLLNMKGFHALETYRIAHALWRHGRRDLALALSNRASLAFCVDIHPAARIGVGVMLDHGSGIVIGETTEVDDNVSILQNVTLGGTGKERGNRHPKVRSGVMIGAGAKILGNIEIGTMSKVAAGSVVLEAVPPYCTVAGVPARVVRRHVRDSLPAFEMDQSLRTSD